MIDFTTPTGMVRLLISDTDELNPIFTDIMLNGFLSVEGQVVKRAAATALEAIATSEVLISKVIKTQDFATDGAKVAADLREHAARLRQQVYDDADDAAAFAFVDYREFPYEWLQYATTGGLPGEFTNP